MKFSVAIAGAILTLVFLGACGGDLPSKKASPAVDKLIDDAVATRTPSTPIPQSVQVRPPPAASSLGTPPAADCAV